MYRELVMDRAKEMSQDLEKARGNIRVKLVNRYCSLEPLSELPHTLVEDLAVIYCVDLSVDEEYRAAMKITHEILSAYGIDKEELHRIAVANVAATGPTVENLVDVLGLPELNDDTDHLYVLTNKNNWHGASVVLDAQFMESLSEQFGDFVLIPSSVHEWILVSEHLGKKMGEDVLSEMIRTVNLALLPADEVLSIHPYKYNAKLQTIEAFH